jgi:hypothetical protein
MREFTDQAERESRHVRCGTMSTVVALALAVLGLADSASAAATPISSCQSIIESPGDYQLTDDLPGCEYLGVAIRANDVLRGNIARSNGQDLFDDDPSRLPCANIRSSNTFGTESQGNGPAGCIE